MSARQAYIARLDGRTAAQLRELIRACVGSGYAFAGDSTRLLAPMPFSDAEAVRLDGEFGQAYGARAEVRWRRDGAAYDALVLTEDERWRPDDAAPIDGDWRVRPAEKPRYVQQTRDGAPVRLIEYVDARGTGATIFARYAEVEP